jgi:hypothetical protein
MSEDHPEIERDEFDQGEHDFYVSINHGGGARPDPTKGPRYVRGWEHAEKVFDLLVQPQTIEEAIARLRNRRED